MTMKSLSLSFYFFCNKFYKTPGPCWFSPPSPACRVARPGGCLAVAGWFSVMVETHGWLCWAAHPVDLGCPAEPSTTPSLWREALSWPLTLTLTPSGWPTSQPSRGLPPSLCGGSPDDFCSSAVPDFLCPQETSGSHCASRRVIGNYACWGPGRGGGFLPSPLSLGCSAISCLPPGAHQVGFGPPLPIPGVYHPLLPSSRI